MGRHAARTEREQQVWDRYHLFESELLLRCDLELAKRREAKSRCAKPQPYSHL